MFLHTVFCTHSCIVETMCGRYTNHVMCLPICFIIWISSPLITPNGIFTFIYAHKIHLFAFYGGFYMLPICLLCPWYFICLICVLNTYILYSWLFIFIYMFIYVHLFFLFLYIYICIYICLYIHMCVCVFFHMIDMLTASMINRIFSIGWNFMIFLEFCS